MEANRGARDDAEQLTELLRRCHRHELLPLAEALRVNPVGLGLRDLAEAVARTLRRRGANDMSNLVLRGGEGPPYAELLRDLAGRVGVEASSHSEQTELSLLSDWVRRSWAELEPAQRDKLWERLDISPPTPVSGDEAVAVAQESLGGRYGYAVGGALLGGAARVAFFTPFAPLAGCATLFWLARPKDHLLLPAVLEVARLRQAVRHRVTVGVVGSPSSGKDAAIKAIFKVDTGNVNPVAGSTTEVEITKLDGATALYVVNTPGLGDIVETVTEEARQVLSLIDVYVYVVNAQGGVQARELADYRSCRASGRPVLAVVNKIDTLREDDRERYLADARAKLGAAPEDFFAVAFDPLPQLSETPIGLGPVRAWLHARLIEQGKSRDELGLLADGDGQRGAGVL